MFDELQSQKEKCLAIVAPSVNLMLESFADSPQNSKCFYLSIAINWSFTPFKFTSRYILK